MKDAAIARERHNTFLNARAGSVIETNEWCTNLERQVHQLVNLFGKHFAKCATKHGEVLTEHKYFASIDRAPTRDHTIGVRVLFKTSRVGAVASQQIQFMKAVWIEQNRQAFTSEQLTFFVLALDRAG